MTGERFGILFVCHANLCRSPLAERLARQTFGERLGASAGAFAISSAGTHARPDLPMHPLSAEVLRERQIDDGDFRSRRLTADLVARAGLVLTASREQRAACVAFEPSAVRRVFTLPQFGRYAAVMSPAGPAEVRPPQERLRVLLDELALVRSTVPAAAAADDELADPMSYPVAAFRRCAAEIQQVLDVMTRLITPARSAALPPPR